MEHEIDEVYEAYMADVGRDNLAKQADAAGEAARAQVEAEEVNAQEPDLREQLFEIVTDTVTTCRRCEFWDIQGKFCFLKDVRPDTVKCRLMDGIMKAMEAADWHHCPKGGGGVAAGYPIWQ